MMISKISTTCLALALVACGGGGDGSVPTPPVPKPNPQLNESNLLDAAAVAYVGNAHNWADYAVLYDDLISAYLVQVEDGTHDCPRGGSVTLKREGQRWNYAVNNCQTQRLSIASGSFEVDASAQSGAGQLTVRLDKLRLLKLWANAPDLQFSGIYQHDLAAGGEPSQHIPKASLTVQSPVSTRQYTAISRTTEASRYRVQSSAFGVVMNVVIGAGYGDAFVASADDGTTISVSSVATGKRIELRSSPQSSPSAVKLYTDSEFRAAVQRAAP
ncbi:hypothetical protein ACS5PK_21610 [Roseateles sp. DB2]|uniref:hypothetical protein n=1 Tax=Roseateles sp. DB2 TaxID=3453717 RepID=UPI003EF03DB5